MTNYIQGRSDRYYVNRQHDSSKDIAGLTQQKTEDGGYIKGQLEKTKQNNQTLNKRNEISKILAKKKEEKKISAVVSVPNMHCQNMDEPNDQHKGPSTIWTPDRTSPVKVILTETEAQLLRNQTETFDKFEEQLKLHESEHFMEQVVAISPIFERKPNVIDDLFNTPGEIPEWLEDDEEIPKEEEVWKNMTEHSTPIKQSNTAENEQTSNNNYVSVEKCNNMDQHMSSYDPISADPAIIHCSKRPDYVETTNVNIASTMKKEYETSVYTINQQRNVMQPPMSQNQISSDYLRNPTEPMIQESDMDRESKDPSMNPICAEKQTAVIKPLGLLSGSPIPATNCVFGQKLLENACRLEDAIDSDDSFLYPGDLAGEAYEADDEHQTRHESEDEAFYFPSFHEDTMLSAHYNKEDVSISHRIQQLQLEQINNYYSQCKDRITDAASMDQSKFLYYAQSAGMDRDRIQQHLQGTVETEQRQVHKERTNRPVLPVKQEPTISKVEKNQIQESIEQSNARHMNQANMQDQGECQKNELPLPNVHQMPAMVQNGHPQGNAPPHSNVPQGVIQQPVPQLPLLQFGVIVPFPPPPLHPANIRNIQSQQAAMSSTVRNKIQEILQSMFKSKVKSVRWRNELSRIRNLPPEKLKVIGKIMIPRDDSDVVYIGYHCSGVTVLGYLSDGSEVAVKIMDSRFRPLKQDETDKLLSVDSSQLFINRYRAIEENNGYCYIAMDLYEYSLPEYLQIISQNKNIDKKIAIEKLIFQLLRGILTLHQHYLIVHGELRPGNIVIDIDGNLKVTGYGIGRNTARDSQRYAEYNDEDKCWLAPEVLLHRQTIVFKTDIWSIGMLIYYIYKDGKNPFGSETREIIQNIAEQRYMMEYISEEAGHLLSMMLSVNKIDRPAIADALKHPMFWAEEQKIRFISIVGSDIVREMKHNYMTDKKQRENSMTAIVSMAPCNITLIRWIQAIEPTVMKEMKTFRPYKNSIVELVVFVYNCCNHFETLSPKVKEIIDEPCTYFLTKFPTLFMTVYRVIKFSNRRDKTCYKPFF
ncbi:uncharacterized protein LOC123548986 [Mercenaria mercenaria]|uniref:uncharacterized protein LOC123548986 n=1 Tax=Mercenaria mercenaria TaxID=6596 RepID=UPI00234F6B80|nr:uncharacterized protein LOC123548986 [Mercenaria mercenaria]